MKKRLGFDIILLGTPASGKDTQAKLLTRKFALKPVESGKYLRGLQRHKTKLGVLLRNNFAKGLPAPVKLIKEFLEANVKLAPKDRDLIFIGNPRLKPEAEFLKKLLQQNQRDYLAFYIQLPNTEIWKRSQRRMRNIDDTKYVAARIAWHKKQVGKTIKYFQRLNKLVLINGNQPIPKVDSDISRAIYDYKRSRAS